MSSHTYLASLLNTNTSPPLTLSLSHPSHPSFSIPVFNPSHRLTDLNLKKVAGAHHQSESEQHRIVRDGDGSAFSQSAEPMSHVYLQIDADALKVQHEYVFALRLMPQNEPLFLKARANESWVHVYEKYIMDLLGDSSKCFVYRVWRGKAYENVTPTSGSDSKAEESSIESMFGRLYGQELIVSPSEIELETNSRGTLNSKRSRVPISSIVKPSSTLKRPKATIPGLCGLMSLGNTCYMNSAIQALTKTPHLKDYFLTGKYKEHISEGNKLGSQGRVVEAFAQIMRDVWSGRREHIYPRDFKNVIGKELGEQFAGEQQQDASELLRLLIDALHEDLNVAAQEKMSTLQTEEDTSLKPITDEHVQSRLEWSTFSSRNNSHILDQFGGQFRDQITCTHCGHKSVRFSPMTTLNLPIPVPEGRRFRILVYKFLNREPPTLYGLELDPKLTVKHLREHLSNLSGIKQQEIVLANIVSRQIFSYYMDNTKLSLIGSNDEIVAYQIPGMTDVDHKVYNRKDPRFIEVRLIVRHHTKYNNTPASFLLPFGEHSLLLPFRKDKTTQEKMYSLVWKSLERYFSPRAAQLFDFETPELFFPYDTKHTHIPELVDDSMLDVNEDPSTENQSFKFLFELRANANDTQKWTSNENCLDFDNTSLYAAQEPILNAQKSYFTLMCVMESDLNSQIVDVTKTHDTVKHISAQEKAPDVTTLSECMQQFSKETSLSEYRCPHCNQQTSAMCKTSIWKTPEVLVVLLKRFKSDVRAGGLVVRAHKIDNKVHFPLKWNVDEMASAKDGPKHQKDFELFSVINHFGSTEFGHYTCCTEIDKEWVLFDDATVKRIDKLKVLNMSSEAYVLLYKAIHH